MSKDKEKEEPKGLGDSIKRVTEAMGIKQCGACKKRQAKLNRLFTSEPKEKNKK